MNSMDLEEALCFHSLNEFKEALHYGAEVVFQWNGQEYGIWADDKGIRVTHTGFPEEECFFSAPDEVLDAFLGGDRLRDILFEIDVLDRS